MSESIIKNVDVKFVAEFLNCSPKTVLEKAGLGDLRGAKIGKSWVFKLSDVIEYFNNQIEQQTIARKNRYKPSLDKGYRRSYEQPRTSKRQYPDLGVYRSKLDN